MWVIVLQATSSGLLNQQNMLNKVFLNKKHIKQGYALHTDKNVVTRGLQEPNSVFLLGAGVQYLLMQYEQKHNRTLWIMKNSYVCTLNFDR